MSRLAHKDSLYQTNPQKYRADPQAIASAAHELNARLQDLSDRILPKQPYLLSVPSDVPYHHSSRYYNSWRTGTPFSRDEERLQYMSLLPHLDEEEELLKAEGGWADETGAILKWEHSPVTDNATRPGTPADSNQRKKISLRDYKSKDKVTPDTPERKAVMEEPRSSSIRRETRLKEPVERGRAEVKKPSVKTESAPVQKPLSANAQDNKPQSHMMIDQKDDSLRPVKRRKLSPEASPIPMIKTSMKEVKKTADESKNLPLLLSPTMPASEKLKKQKLLPDLLSPNLPSALQIAVTTPQRSDEVRAVLKSSIGSPAPISEKKASSIAHSERTAVVDNRFSSQSTSAAQKDQSPMLKPSVNANIKVGTPLQNGNASPSPYPERAIVLRYGKKNRKRVERLLNCAARPKKTVGSPIKSQAIPIPVKAIVEEPIKEKKPLVEASEERPVKKPKAVSTNLEPPMKQERPVTPTPITASKSPAAQANGSVTKAKPAFTTPKKEQKSFAMQRIASSEGEVRTPQMDMARTLTPLSVSQVSTQKASPGPGSNPGKGDDRVAWTELNEKYFAIGRSLKREGTELNKTAASEGNGKDHALSVVLLVEALVCFMVNLAAQAYARPTVDPGWSTIILYHIFVFRQSRKYRHLHGLVVQLGAVCRQFIHNHDMERLARDPLPDENCGSAPTPGSDGNTKTTDDSERYKKKYLEFRDTLVQNARELQTAWLDSSRLLSTDLLEKEYSRTWAIRARDTSRRGHEKLNPRDISRNFFLPLDVSSNAFETMRFAMSFLNEWCDKESIEWKSKIDL